MPVCVGFDQCRDPAASCIHIGLLNNMPDAALQSTERQFLTLIDAAAGEIDVRLWFFSLPEVPRGEAGRRHIGSFYSGIASLWNSHLDGLIMTGTEPLAENLSDEPYWTSITKVLEWADHNTHSTILSCLGAHAALLHFDGIARHRLPSKCCGLFDSVRTSDHPLTAGIPERFGIPQSRWNGVHENDLTAARFQILTRAQNAGADMFVKRRKSMFVFFQGHPEYEADTLFLEYRRDVGRYLRKESETYPLMPQGYFDAETTGILAALQKRALSDRRKELLSEFPAIRSERILVDHWRSAAVRIYRNWIRYLLKEQRLKRSSGLGTMPRGAEAVRWPLRSSGRPGLGSWTGPRES